MSELKVDVKMIDDGYAIRADTRGGVAGGTWLRPSAFGADAVRVARERAAEYRAIGDALESQSKLIAGLERAYETCGVPSNEAGLRAVLAHLHEIGRLAPIDGPVLDTAQWEDVRLAFDKLDEPESWARWQDVPAGVLYRSAAGPSAAPLTGLTLTFVNNADGRRWIQKRSGVRRLSDSKEERMKRLAPFVRVEADGDHE